jgi:two-component system sensor histidine kinase ChvG
VEGYRLAYREVPIAFALPAQAAVVDGAPDLCAQMLDKLVANAVEFRTGGAIDVALDVDGAAARLTVANEGPPLPDGMEGRLFDSMVSVRAPGREGEGPHLGLGLYIVRLIAQFHGGGAAATNRADGRGVAVTVVLPLASADSSTDDRR